LGLRVGRNRPQQRAQATAFASLIPGTLAQSACNGGVAGAERTVEIVKDLFFELLDPDARAP
jgi:hypothetical protein